VSDKKPLQKGDLLDAGFGRLAVVIGIDEVDVHFVFLNHRIRGTGQYEVWRVSKGSIRMNVLSAA
jgi:hypothetical protein